MPERDRNVVRERVNILRTAYASRVQSGDAAAMADLYAEDAIVLPATGGRFVGREQIQASYQATFDQGAVSFQAEPRSFDLSGDFAVEEGAVTFSVTPEGGEPQQVQADYLVVATEVDGDWKIVRLMSKPAPPAEG